MKMQWVLLVGGILSVTFALFAIVNVDKVSVNYIFGEGQWPLVLIILVSVVTGFVISTCFAVFKLFERNLKIRQLEKTLQAKERLLIDLKARIQQASNTEGITVEEEL
jgi:lipopolysaccharide assembly protein A